ncbi:MAG: hypothetical protein LWW93_01730 [Hyphomicrobiales bacterium]|nr:hypothetical protein [Hyphomicrobiales bacterium]
MQEIIDRIAAQVGIEPDLAHKATSMIVNFIVTQAPSEYVDMIRQHVPGFDEIAATGAAHSEASEEAAGGGLMGALGGLMGGGGIAGALGSLMGGSQGGGMAAAMAMLGTLQKDGLELGQVKDVAGGLIGQLRQVAGDETVEKLLAQIPGADHLVG